MTEDELDALISQLRAFTEDVEKASRRKAAFVLAHGEDLEEARKILDGDATQEGEIPTPSR